MSAAMDKLTGRQAAGVRLLVGDPIRDAITVPVKSSDGARTYLVTVGTSLATSGCTCPSRSAGFCKHQIAVRASLMLNDQLPEWGCEPVAVPA